MEKSILDMLAMETAEPDATLTPLDVFGEKSKDADDAVEYGMGLSQEELLDIVMSVTPMGGVKAGKGAISFLKGLLGKAKSPAKNIIKKKTSAFEDEMVELLYDKSEASKAKLIKNLRKMENKSLDQSLFELKEKGNMLTKITKEASKYLAEDQKAIDESIKRMKGMRQFGKFNRQKWEK